MCSEFEYRGKFEFLYETNLEYESGSQVGSFDKKKPAVKNLIHEYI